MIDKILSFLGPMFELFNRLVKMFSKTPTEKDDEAKREVVDEREDLKRDPSKRPPSDPFPM